MNTTRTTPPPSTPKHSLTAHQLALDATSTAVALALKLPGPLRSLGDQLIRSASSVPANLAEGAGRAGATGSTTGASPTPRRWRPTATCACCWAPARWRPPQRSAPSTSSTASGR
ncbi:MAG: four helix bundle protein [Acidobacteriota bacterium]